MSWNPNEDLEFMAGLHSGDMYMGGDEEEKQGMFSSVSRTNTVHSGRLSKIT